MIFIICECFITSDKNKNYVDYVGHNYIIIKDIFTHEPIEIYVGDQRAKVWKKECSDGETIYVFYDKENINGMYLEL